MIAVIDYGMGNLHSIVKSLEYVSNEEIITTRKKQDIISSEKIVLPGVGAFGDAIINLSKYNLIELIKEEILLKKKPFLGICLGMQILTEVGFEYGEHPGLGIIPGRVIKFSFDSLDYRIPHVGWNDVSIDKNVKPLSNIKNGTDFYFCHSFHMDCKDKSWICATCNYGNNFVAAVAKNNVFATQFHPEKSQKWGLKILKNFVEWDV